MNMSSLSGSKSRPKNADFQFLLKSIGVVTQSVSRDAVFGENLSDCDAEGIEKQILLKIL